MNMHIKIKMNMSINAMKQKTYENSGSDVSQNIP